MCALSGGKPRHKSDRERERQGGERRGVSTEWRKRARKSSEFKGTTHKGNARPNIEFSAQPATGPVTGKK